MQKLKIHYLISVLISGIIVSSCSNNNDKSRNDNGQSPANESEQQILESYKSLGVVDSALYATGKDIFQAKCIRCHDFGIRKAGPALNGITKRHSASWITNLLANVSQRSKLDSIVAHSINNFSEAIDSSVSATLAPVTTEEERRALIEFLRGNNGS